VDRLDKIRAALSAQDAGLLCLSPGDDMRYALGFSTPYDERLCFLLVGERGAALVVPGVNATDARTRLQGTSVEVFDYADNIGPVAALKEARLVAGGDGSARTLLVSDDARYDHARRVGEALAPERVELASLVMRGLRLIKDEDEIRRLRVSAGLADQAMEAGFRAIRRGMTEAELSDIIRAAFVEAGADQPSFMLVAYGPNGAEPHHHVGSTRIGEGPIVLDIGCRGAGYASDMTRMAYLGTPDPEYLKVHEIVYQARMAGEHAARVGAPCSAVDLAARTVIEEAGYGEYFVHRTGHGIGVSTHEPPSMMAGDETILEPGMAFSIEPGIYLPGRFGVRIEDVAVMHADGPEILSRLTQAPRVVEG
jgi:Xaa-Pro dipeptidase